MAITTQRLYASNITEESVNFFYKPRPGIVGDCIPYFYNGRYHIFYLRTYRDPDSYGSGVPWHHVSTDDFVHFEDHGEALSPGRTDEHDLIAGTGCVYTDDQDKHHIFYTGINHYFRNDTQYAQVLLHATSDDLMTWSKHTDEGWYPDESTYERHDWRDPFIFRHPTTGRYNMLIHARLKEGPVARRGCTALLTSDDLIDWTVEEPFYAPARYHGHECPDWFKMGDWYYLVFSEYNDQTVTRYVMSRSPDGPWIAPVDNQFDNRAFYAAKSASDGSRRLLFGWNPTKDAIRKETDSTVDAGTWQWGGCLTVHEIIQNGDDGKLAVRMPPEAARAFGAARRVRFEQLESGWTLRDGTYSAQSPYGYSAALSGRMPETYLLRGEITFEKSTGSTGVLLKTDDAGDSGYFLRFNLDNQRLEFGKVGGYRRWPHIDHMPELDRPLQVRTGIPLRFSIIVDKTAMVAYVNHRVALSGRMYMNPHGRVGLFADGTAMQASGVEILSLHG